MNAASVNYTEQIQQGRKQDIITSYAAHMHHHLISMLYCNAAELAAQAKKTTREV